MEQQVTLVKELYDNGNCYLKVPKKYFDLVVDEELFIKCGADYQVPLVVLSYRDKENLFSYKQGDNYYLAYPEYNWKSSGEMPKMDAFEFLDVFATKFCIYLNIEEDYIEEE